MKTAGIGREMIAWRLSIFRRNEGVLGPKSDVSELRCNRARRTEGPDASASPPSDDWSVHWRRHRKLRRSRGSDSAGPHSKEVISRAIHPAVGFAVTLTQSRSLRS